jgi:GT2 family glycosyltransferase
MNRPARPDLPLISVVVATRERPECLQRCLLHLSAQDYPFREIVVIDNSIDRRSEAVLADFPEVKYLRGSPNTDNVAWLRNVALGHTMGDIAAFVDDDAYVAAGWFQAIADAFSDCSVGGATGRIIAPGVPVENSSVIGRLSPNGEYAGSGYNNTWPEIVEVDHLPGCNMAVRRCLIEMIGGFDPLMHFSREDIELGLRIKSAGYRLVFQPAAIVHHVLAPRPQGTVRRADHDLRSRFVHCRSFVYLFARYYGLRLDFAKTAFWRLPRQDYANLVRTPSFDNLSLLSVTLGGVLAGYYFASLARLGLHRVPHLSAI